MASFQSVINSILYILLKFIQNSELGLSLNSIRLTAMIKFGF
ncbi:hypothetical protein CSUNSWCD_1125 [Campylobacter showae CSUNSWCD]|uniref:Uncharacterized protein n=1 Tax=Campylobacter showae CSUNSWCD TaxID=1244083 RepID=M5IRG9_9BACT|nr:hypothetical protein CSUNSWCD_1125 [Campylobacter showae CSUNSWCD]